MPEPKRPLKVFLCHAHADRDAVRALYTRLTNDGVDAWLDKEKLLPGQEWKSEIERAVREADVVIVCLSNGFNKEGFRQKEVVWALDKAEEKLDGTIYIIPVLLENCEIPHRLAKYHVVDLFEVNGYEKLFNALKFRSKEVDAIINANYHIEIDKFQLNPALLNGEIGKLSNLAFLNLNNGAYKKSLEYYKQAMELAFQIKDIYSQCVIALGLGVVYWNLDDHAEARGYFKMAIHLSEQLGDKRLKVSALNNLAFTFESIGDLVRATELYEDALLLSREIGS